MKGAKIYIYPDRTFLVVLVGEWREVEITYISGLMSKWRWYGAEVVPIPDWAEVHFVNP